MTVFNTIHILLFVFFNFKAQCLIDDIQKVFSNLLLILSVLFTYFDGMICRLMHQK